MMDILKTLVIAFLIVFVLELIGSGNLVNNAVEFTKEQAAYANKHGFSGLVEKIWCGHAGCWEEK